MSSDGIATALKDSASSLVAANNTYEEAVALIASANRVVQDPGSVGAALRTISLRLRGTSTRELEEAGEDTTGVVESKSKLRTKIQGYTGVDILTDTGAYKSTYEILLEISKVWDDLTDTDQAGLLELIAGKTRSNTAAAILSNGEDLKDALLAAQEAEGSALAENEKYLDSIQGKLDQFNNAVQTMWSNTLNDEWIKGIVEIGTFLVESIDNLGAIKTLLTVIGAGIIQKYFKGDLFGGFFGDTSSIESVKKGITDLEESYARAQAKFNSSKSTEDRKAMEDAKANLDAFKEANQPILDAEERKTALNEQLEKLKAEREQLRGDLQTAQDNLVDITTNGVQEDVREFVEIDTSHIDNQIAGVQEKLDTAKQQLVDAESSTWDDYKTLGSMAPAKDRDNRVNDKKKEIKELEAELDNLQTKKDEFMSTKIDEVVTDGAKTQVTDLTNKIDETDKAIQQTEVELQKVEVQANATGNAGLTAGQKFKTGFDRAKATIKKFGKEMLKSMAWSMAIAAVFEAFGTVGTWISDAFKAADKSAEALQDKLEELDSELSAVESELRSLQSELKDTDERIEELMSQGTLTFVEQEELNKLKSVSAELKAQIGLQETLQKSLQQGVNSASIDATDTYLDTSFMSEKSKTERQEKGKEKGEGIGQIVGTVLGIIGGAVAAYFTAGTAAPIGYATGMTVGTALGSGIGKFAGGLIGENAAGSAYDSEQSVGEAMDNMLETRAKLKEEQDKALAENDAEAYNEATEALRTYDAQMAKHISQIQQNYNAMDWELADPETRKQMMEYADWLDKYNISMGTDGAKSNAIARIFGDEAQGNIAKARDEINRLKKNLIEAKNKGKGVDEALAALEGFKLNLSEDEVERLREMGIYLYEVEDYFKEVVEAESEFVDGGLEDVAKDINKITDGLDSLKSAFDEVIEEGILTAKTILSIKNSLGIGDSVKETQELTDAWSNYLKVMMSGTATTEQMIAATEQLTQAWIEDALVHDNLTPETKMEFVAQLKVLGVENANEYVEDLLQKNMVEEIENKLSYDEDLLRQNYTLKHRGKDDKNFDQLTAEEKKQFAEEYGLLTVPSDIIEDIKKRYGVEKEEIQDVIGMLQQKVNLEQQISDIQNKKKAYEKWRNGDGPNKGILALQDDIEAFETNSYYARAKKAYDAIYNKGSEAFNGDYGLGYDEYLGYEYNGAHYTSLSDLIFALEEEIGNGEKELASLRKQYSDLWAEGEEKGYIVDGKIIDPNYQSIIDGIYDQIQGIEAELDEEYTLDIQLKLDLQNKSKLVDDIQNVFDSLADAVNEYNENGYLTVDTAQALTDPDNVDPKYLTLLKDENGQLSLTKENLYQVAIARLTDLKVKRQDAILTDAENSAKSGSIEALRESSEVLYGEADALQTVNKERLKTIRGILEERQAKGELVGFDINAYMTNLESQVDATGKIFDSAISNIQNSISTSGNTVTKEIEDAFQKLMDYYDNRIEANQAKYDQIQNDIDWLEKQGKMADADYYRDQIALMTEGEESKTKLLEAKLQGASDRLQELERAGKQGSDEWWEAAKIYNDTLSELDDVRDAVLDLQDTIGEIEWSKFEELNNRLDDTASKLETIRDLIAPNGEEDWFDDEGNWTDKGVAVLGSYVQSLEYYKNGLTEASNALDEFNTKSSYEGNEQWYADNYGIHSEQEYYDYLQKLTDEQYKYAKSVSDTEQDIAGMWESQVDAVEEYMDSLVEAYSDYIDNVKEALDAERDLYDFKKKIQKQTKDMAALERRIASLSGSTNAADIAERRKLEAELYESRESLNDEYTEHSKQSQQEALDAESEAYEEAMTRFVKNLRTNLDLALQDMDTFIDGVTSAVTVNAPTILGVYEDLGIALDSAIVDPWQAAIDAMGEDGYSGAAGLGLMNSWVAKGGVFDTFATNATAYLTSIWDDTNVDPGGAFANAVGGVVEGIVSTIQRNVEEAKGYLGDLYDTKDYSGGTYEDNPDPEPEPEPDPDPRPTFHLANTLGQSSTYFTRTSLGVTTNTVRTIDGKDYLYVPSMDSYFLVEGKERFRNKDDKERIWEGYSFPKGTEYYKYYAKGTTGTSRDEWAITDEPQFGDELVLVPTAQGTLSYMRKGTGVVPADLTENLMQWGQFTPDSLNLGNGVNVNMINNAVIKPQYDFNFDSLVHVDHCDQGTLEDLEKMVDNKIDKFSKDLNYSIKRFTR